MTAKFDPNEPSSELVEAAQNLARRAHAGQIRKTGEPYFNHPDRVARLVSVPPAQAVAFLHDVLEDCKDPALLDELNRFPEPIITAVKLLTRTPKETYFDFHGGRCDRAANPFRRNAGD